MNPITAAVDRANRASCLVDLFADRFTRASGCETVPAMQAHTTLGSFEPLQRLLFYDDFNDGVNGWGALIGNYEDRVDAMLPEYMDMRPPMLSNLTMWDAGTSGAIGGAYALKLATRAKPGTFCTAIKRYTFRTAGPLRVEAIVTFKPEANELELGETAVRAFGVLLDLQHADGQAAEPLRVMPHIRYLNAFEGRRAERWQYKNEREPLHDIGTRGKTWSHFHFKSRNWADIPGGAQRLCYNEIATKHNWYYLRMDFDLAGMRFLGFRCNELDLDVAGIEPMRLPAMPNLWSMLNVAFFVESDAATRAFLYVDSVAVSTAT